MTPAQRKMITSILEVALASQYDVEPDAIEIVNYVLDDDSSLATNNLSAFVEHNELTTDLVFSKVSFKIEGEEDVTHTHDEVIVTMKTDTVNLGYEQLRHFDVFSVNLSE